MDDKKVEDETNPFLVLCDPRIERLYALQFGEIAEDCLFEFRFVTDPITFALRCLQRPPTAGLIDLGSLVRGNSEKMNILFTFRTRWPVLRTRIGSDGKADIMRVNPPITGPLQETMVDLINNRSVFENSDESRLTLRRSVRLRARVRPAQSSDDWCRVNIRNLSRDGCLVIASDPPSVGTRVEVEIRDLPGGSAQLEAEVAWSRGWDDSTEIPRCGLQFCAGALPEAMFDALGNPDHSMELC